MIRGLSLLLVCIILSLGTASAFAGVLDRAKLEKQFPPPLVVGEKDDQLPIWPILKQNGGAMDVFAYAYESAAFAPINGFGGVPIDLLVALGPDGSFRDVKVLSQHEPVFVDGLGEEPLFAFVQQYVGMSARRAIHVGRPNARSGGAAVSSVVDGVAMATASTRVINESILGSALAVARKKLGFGTLDTVGLRVTAKTDGFQPMTWDQLLAKGYVKRLRLTTGDVDKAFGGSPATSPGDGKEDDIFADTYVADLEIPSIGRNLLGDAGWKAVAQWLAPGDHAIFVLAAGPWSPLGEDFVLGSIPDRIAVLQNGLQVNARDLAIEREGRGIAGMPDGQWTILKITEAAGFDPSRPWNLSLRVTRERGQILAEKVNREFATTYSLPADLFVKEQPDAGPSWTDSWRARWVELAAILVMLAVLVPVLVWQKALVARPRAFAIFRHAYLAVTLGFIGWYAQAQLSIVTLVGVIRNAKSGSDFSFLLYDPPSLVLWIFSLVALIVWGRGTFCGWLCPFGALQELLAAPARILRLPQFVVPPRLDNVLRNAKYLVLGGIVLSAVMSTTAADELVEVEPFKTSITLYFVRYWPFVVYALGLLLLNLYVYKGFCRYLCPLGASLAVLGRIRVLDWIPRRAECGSPCQLCRVKCRYGAIEPGGAVTYHECFQCMDCVTIILDPAQCVPQIVARKKGRRLDPKLQPAE